MLHMYVSLLCESNELRASGITIFHHNESTTTNSADSTNSSGSGIVMTCVETNGKTEIFLLMIVIQEDVFFFHELCPEYIHMTHNRTKWKYLNVFS